MKNKNNKIERKKYAFQVIGHRAGRIAIHWRRETNEKNPKVALTYCLESVQSVFRVRLEAQAEPSSLLMLRTQCCEAKGGNNGGNSGQSSREEIAVDFDSQLPVKKLPKKSREQLPKRIRYDFSTSALLPFGTDNSLFWGIQDI